MSSIPHHASRLLRAAPALAAIACWTSCGLFGDSDADRALVQHEQNASLYWEYGNVEQAVDQVEQGLEIDPSNYKLKVIRSYCYLRQVAQRTRSLDDALAAVDDAWKMRSPSGHGGQLLLARASVYAQLAVGLRRKVSAAQAELDQRALSEAERAVVLAELADDRTASEEALAIAEAPLHILVDRGDLLLQAHYNLMSVLWMRGDYAGAVENGHAYLARAETLQDRVRSEIQRTTVMGYEEQERERLTRLLDDEASVRAYLANLHFKQGNHELVVEQLDQVLDRNPRLYTEYYNRGRSLVALGRRTDAKRDFERFVGAADPQRDSVQIQEALENLVALR